MHPYFYEKVGQQRRNDLEAAAHGHRLAREAGEARRSGASGVERPGLLAGRLRRIFRRAQPVRPVGYVGPVRWAGHPAALASELRGRGASGEA